MASFDKKVFNENVFAQYMSRVPDPVKTAFLDAGVLERVNFKTMFAEQVGGHYGTIPFKGILGGDEVNYDGNTNIGADSMDTYAQNIIVVGRAKGWKETDFSQELTGVDFLEDAAGQAGRFWNKIDQKIILAKLKGMFAASGGSNANFAKYNTTDISDANDADDQVVNATTLNNTIQKAAGDNKELFTVAIMHSQVATNLENLNLLEYLKYTDPAGVQKRLKLAQWNGVTVLVDDSVPAVEVGPTYAKADASGGTYDADGTYYTKSGSVYTLVLENKEADFDDYYVKTADGYMKYTTYVLGKGAFKWDDVGVKYPVELDRDAAKNGGETMLYTRQRKVFAPAGFSYKKSDVVSPTYAQLETGSNWEVVKNATSTYNHKGIPFARIISRG